MNDAKDAQRWRALLRLGRCDSKHGGLSVGDSLKAKLAFRFWCTPEEAEVLVDQHIDEPEPLVQTRWVNTSERYPRDLSGYHTVLTLDHKILTASYDTEGHYWTVPDDPFDTPVAHTIIAWLEVSITSPSF